LVQAYNTILMRVAAMQKRDIVGDALVATSTCPIAKLGLNIFEFTAACRLKVQRTFISSSFEEHAEKRPRSSSSPPITAKETVDVSWCSTLAKEKGRGAQNCRMAEDVSDDDDDLSIAASSKWKHALAFASIDPNYSELLRNGTTPWVIIDLEFAHNSQRGKGGYYDSQGMWCDIDECQDWRDVEEWKSRCEPIEIGIINMMSGETLSEYCRPSFTWDAIPSKSYRGFAEKHGHDNMIKDMSLPHFYQVWSQKVEPFLVRASNGHGYVHVVAHNGNSLDFKVLNRYLDLGLIGCSVDLHFVDTVQAAKEAFGSRFGQGGKLQLEYLVNQCVPKEPSKAHALHSALSDCVALRAVLQNFPNLLYAVAKKVHFYAATRYSEQNCCSEQRWKAERYFGFALGDTVQWTRADFQIPPGTTGQVVGFNNGAVFVEFPRCTDFFDPLDLKLALTKGTGLL